jgi:CheY-like chemotaxis protein
MLALINDILDFSRIDSDGIKLQNESLDLHELLNQQRSLFNPMAQEKGLALSLEVSPSLPKYVRGDALRIRQILQNLLSNAIKFTDRGTITIEAAAAGATSEAETRTISLGVRDTGIGIPESEFDNLYVPFFQLNEASVVNRGTGLGLPIAKMLTELMDGEISVESTPGAGSYFCAKLQLELAQPTESTLPESYEPKEMSTSSVAGLRVLLAEDNPVNAGLVKLYLNSSGTILDVAGNGAEAVEMHASGHYDAILMDFEMPIMDGLEATRRIRQAESGSSHRVPIIGVTANALDEDIKRCLDAGMNTVLSKPFKKAQLIQMIAGVTSAGGNSKGVAAN